jgi:ATP-dependent 26S proteasome regulatory subunit
MFIFLVCHLVLTWKLVVSYRHDAHFRGEREIQRTMLELLNQLDGVDACGDVKVILTTNRIETVFVLYM